MGCSITMYNMQHHAIGNKQIYAIPILHNYAESNGQQYDMRNRQHKRSGGTQKCDNQYELGLRKNSTYATCISMCNTMCNMPCAIGSNTIGVGDAPLSTPSCPLMALPTSLIPSSSSSLSWSSSASPISSSS